MEIERDDGGTVTVPKGAKWETAWTGKEGAKLLGKKKRRP